MKKPSPLESKTTTDCVLKSRESEANLPSIQRCREFLEGHAEPCKRKFKYNKKGEG